MGEYLTADRDNALAGGVFNSRNLQTYHYGGNNPIKYTDPSGRSLKINEKGRMYVDLTPRTPNSNAGEDQQQQQQAENPQPTEPSPTDTRSSGISFSTGLSATSLFISKLSPLSFVVSEWDSRKKDQRIAYLEERMAGLWNVIEDDGNRIREKNKDLRDSADGHYASELKFLKTAKSIQSGIELLQANGEDTSELEEAYALAMQGAMESRALAEKSGRDETGEAYG